MFGSGVNSNFVAKPEQAVAVGASAVPRPSAPLATVHSEDIGGHRITPLSWEQPGVLETEHLSCSPQAQGSQAIYIECLRRLQYDVQAVGTSSPAPGGTGLAQSQPAPLTGTAQNPTPSGNDAAAAFTADRARN